jgi:hypothetical protein
VLANMRSGLKHVYIPGSVGAAVIYTASHTACHTEHPQGQDCSTFRDDLPQAHMTANVGATST